jgi:hypothetical protein
MKYYLIYSVLFVTGVSLFYTPRIRERYKYVQVAALVMVSLAMALFLWEVTIPNANYVDFTLAYYEAGQDIISNPEALYKGRQPEFVNIPIVAYLFSPFNLVNINQAVQIMVFISVVASLGVCYLLFNIGSLQGYRRLLVILLVAANGPLFYSIRLGNTTHFVLLLLSIIMVLGHRMQLLTGALAAVCAIVKLPLMLFGLYYLFRRRWAMALGFWGTALVIISCSLFIFGLDLHLKWYLEIIQRYSGKTIGAYNIQSVNGFLAHLMPDNYLYSWQEFSTGLDFKLAQLVLLCLIVIPSGMILWRSGAPSDSKAFNLEFSIVLCVSILVSPISWIHYYLLLLAPLALLLSDGVFAISPMPVLVRKWRHRVLLVTIVLISLPVVHTLPDSIVPGIPVIEFLCKHVLVSHYFFGGLILLSVLLYTRLNMSTAPQRY